MQEKAKELAKTIVNYSIKVEKNEKVLITTETDKDVLFINYLIDEITLRGGIPSVKIVNPVIASHLTLKTTDERIKFLEKISMEEVNNYDSFIQIRYFADTCFLHHRWKYITGNKVLF